MKKKKKTKWLKHRHKVITKLADIVLRPIAKRKYGADLERFKEQGDRQYLIIANHQTAYDQFFLGMVFKGPIYYVASEDLFSLGFKSKLIKFAVNPIPITKQKTDMVAVMNCIKVAKEGGTVALFPEGNRTFSGKTEYFNPAIVKLAKMLKLPIAIVRIEGGYGVQPRWSDCCRKGKMHIGVSQVLEVEDYMKLKDDELFNIIKEGINVNEANADHKFYSPHLAEYVERFLYVCPDCGLSEFESHGDTFRCKHCGKEYRYLPSTELEGIGFDSKFHFLNDWYEYQNDFMNALDLKKLDNKLIYEDDIQFLEVIPFKNKKAICKTSKLFLYNNRMEVHTPKEKFILDFSDISVATIQGKNRLSVYYKDKLYQFAGDAHFNPMKYMHMYYHWKNVTGGKKDEFFLGI